MTILQRLMRAMAPNTKLNAGFEQYYSKLLTSSHGDSGMPTASEAQRDMRAALDQQLFYL